MRRCEYYIDAREGPKVETGQTVREGELLGMSLDGKEVRTLCRGKITMIRFDGDNSAFVVTECRTCPDEQVAGFINNKN